MSGIERQRKQITVLFADVSGFTAMSETMDAEDVAELMNALWQRLDGIIVAHGGRIDKHIGDAVMALWGADITREDDPQRAIHAALAMHAELRKFSDSQASGTQLHMRIGINTGPALLGQVGTTGEFTALGDTVNTASRLEQAAPVGAILISQATEQHVHNVFDLIQRPPLEVKGKGEPLTVFAVARARQRTFLQETRGIEGVETRMIGRDAQLELLQDSFYATAQNQKRQVITFVGEVGVGKSRLLREFDLWLSALPKQITIFRGRAGQEMQSRPFALLRDIFARRFEILDSDTRLEVQRKLEQGIFSLMGTNDESRKGAHFIGHLLGYDFSGSPYLIDLLEDPGKIRDQAVTHLAGYVAKVVSENQTVIFLEDTQWADDSSLDTINALLEALPGRPLMVVCMARPGLLERRPNWADGQDFHTRQQLEPLSKEETRLLVAEILERVVDLPETLQELIIENSQGNPFYVEELIKMLIEDEVIITSSSRWLVNPTRLPEVRIPPTLTGVLQARLDSLSKGERLTLQRASVIGRAFWDEILVLLEDEAETAGDGEDAAGKETSQILEKLQQRELVFPQPAGSLEGAQEYAFKNVVLREVTYESVLKRERQAYHARVAQWLIDRSGERAQEYASLIAEHLERGRQVSEAVVYLRYAGEQAQKSNAFKEALNFFKRALNLLAASDRQERLVLTRQIGRALYELGHWDAAKEQLQESLNMAREMASPHEIANNLRTLGMVAEAQGKYDEAKTWMQESLSTARTMADPGQIVASLRALGNVAEKQGLYTEAKDRLEESLDLIRKYGDQVGANQAAYVQGAMDRMSGALEAAKSRFSQGLSRLKVNEEKKKQLGSSFSALGKRIARKSDNDEEDEEEQT